MIIIGWMRGKSYSFDTLLIRLEGKMDNKGSKTAENSFNVL